MISVVLSDIHKNYLIFQHFIGGSALSGMLSEKAKWRSRQLPLSPIERTGPAWRGIVWPRLFYTPGYSLA